MAAKKRKNPSVGIFDPNYSQDPQFGNVSTLKPGHKRVHLLYEGEIPTDFWMRFLIRFPECDVPRIDSRNIDKVDEIVIPIVKEFTFVLSQSSKANDAGSKGIIQGGLFENSKLSRNFPKFKNAGAESDAEINLNRGEIIFALNNPIAYSVINRGKLSQVSNMSERGYVLLQNYVFLHVHSDFMGSASDIECFNAYIDYELCTMKYKDALVWKADFEKYISPSLKYRVFNSSLYSAAISRGDCEIRAVADPGDFPDPVNSSSLYRVATRDVEKAGLSDEEFAWTQAVRKYIGGDEDESS